jgi:uncharacterized phiE125 gp8 family phage protein
MPSILLSGSALEPVSLAEAKNFLRVEHDADDDLIALLIAGARGRVETQTRRALITQSWRLVRDRWPAGPLDVLPVPLQALTAARVHRADGSTQAIDLAAFTLDTASAPARLAFAGVPAPGRAVGGIELDIVAGYGDAAEDVPEPLRQAIRQFVVHWYENRGLVTIAQGFTVPPAGAHALIAPYRVLSL